MNPGAVGSAGILRITGNYTQSSGGTLKVEVGGTTPGSGYDQLAVSGAATLGGTLNVSLLHGFTLGAGTNDQILTFSTRNNTGFSSSTGLPSGFVPQFNDTTTPANISLVPGQTAFTVTNPTDLPVAGHTDLRQAIAAANLIDIADTIVFATPQTITLGGTQLTLDDPAGTTIVGPGANLLSISGNNASPVFVIDAGASAAISGLTITAGSVSSMPAAGGAGLSTQVRCH